jgi:hypothetical protein
MEHFDFLLGTLATWRVAALLVREDGPFDAIARLRRAAAGTVAGRALECFFCTSLWVAAPFALWVEGAARRWPVVWLAVAGGAALLERLSAPREAPAVDLSEAERRNERFDEEVS